MNLTESVKECPLFSQEYLDETVKLWGAPFRIEISYRGANDAWGWDYWQLNFTHHSTMEEVCKNLPNFIKEESEKDPTGVWRIDKIEQIECAIYSVGAVLVREDRSR